MAATSGTGNTPITVTASSNARSTQSPPAKITVTSHAVEVTHKGTTCTCGLALGTATQPAAGASWAVGVIAPAVGSWTSSNNGSTRLIIAASANAGSG